MLTLSPIGLAESAAFVLAKHRHHKPPRGHKFSIAAAVGDTVVAVVIVGRPTARHNDDGYTLEVTRLCSDGTPNCCSFLYAAAWRAAKAMGYTRLITYILDTETGASLRAANWRCVGASKGDSWSRPSRPRVDTHPLQGKILFQAV